MSFSLDQLLMGLRLHRVSRFQTHNMIEPMSVAAHSFRVGLLYLYLGGKEAVPAFLHDAEEALTGDLPSPTKSRLPAIRIFEQLRPEFEDEFEKRLCKLADKLDLVLHIRPQAKFDEDLGSVYEEEYEEVLSIAKELKKTKEVKKIIRVKGNAEWVRKVLDSVKTED